MAELEKLHEDKNELELYKVQTEKELGALRGEIKAMAQAQLEWKNSLVELQSERERREQEWEAKETSWEASKKEWEKTIAELEKAKEAAALAAAQAPAPTQALATVGPEAAKALTAIRQQMQEMQTLLTWLRPVKKQPLSRAA